MIKISDAELEVMKIIWERKETTSLEIIKELEHCNWNNNTIRTLINRLIAKKAVGISKKEGKTYTYVPLIKESIYTEKQMRKFIKQFFNNSSIKFLNFIFEQFCIKKRRKRRYFMKKYNGKPNMLGSFLKRKREEIGMSANDVCNKLQEINVAMSRAELYRIENEKMILKDFELLALCVVLEIDVKEITDKKWYKK